jgi:hypothetical protein
VVGHAIEPLPDDLHPGIQARCAAGRSAPGVRRLAASEPELFVVIGELALRSRRDPVIAAIFKETIDAWHGTLRTLVQHAQSEGFVDPRLDPDTVAALVIATLDGLFMVPAAGTALARVDKTLGLLESFLGLKR